MPLRRRKQTRERRARTFFSTLYRDLLGRPGGDTDAEAAGLKVYLFNVGQGDHILLEFPNDEYGIVDFYYEETLGLMEPPALTYLDHIRRSHPEKKIVISFICLSHPDYDHIKGVDSFLSWVVKHKIKVNHFWLFAGSNFDDMYEHYEKAIEKYAENQQERDDAFEFKDRLDGIRKFIKSKWGKGREDYLQGIRLLGDSVGGCTQVQLLAPLTRHVRKFDRQAWMDLFRLFIQGERLKGERPRTAETNLLSSVLFVKFKAHGLLFGGDTGINIWLECLKEFWEQGHAKYVGGCEANFVKVSHHGSKNSSAPELWEQILKRRADCYLGISAGRRYDPPHPHAETLADIAAAAKRVGSRATILSTNTCTACVAAPKIPEEKLDWLRYPSPDYPDATMETYSLIAPRGVGNEEARPVLYAYIFDFAPAGEEVGLTKALSPLKSDYIRCVYNNGHTKHFPHCARP
jgi:beta-lactamase superfamily II metal-dependent hydrolase